MSESNNGTPSCCVWQAVAYKAKCLGVHKYTRKHSQLSVPPLNAVAEAAIYTSPPRSRCACPLAFLASATVKASCLCWNLFHCLSGSFRGQIKVFLLDFKGNNWSGFRKDHMWISELLWHMSSSGTMQASKFRMQQLRVGDRASSLKRLVCRINFQRKLEYH